jgi:hypothetical protein
LTPIYNRSGQVCGWAEDEAIRDMQGRVVAFIFDISIPWRVIAAQLAPRQGRGLR